VYRSVWCILHILSAIPPTVLTLTEWCGFIPHELNSRLILFPLELHTFLSNVIAVNFDTSTSPAAKWWVHHEHHEFHLLPILATYSPNDRLCVTLPAPPQSASRKFPRCFLTNYVCLYCLPVSCMPSRLACWFTYYKNLQSEMLLIYRCERRVSGTCVAASWMQIPEIMFEVVIVSNDTFMPDFVNIGQLFQTFLGGGSGLVILNANRKLTLYCYRLLKRFKIQRFLMFGVL